MKIHIVQKGDTLWGIAEQYGVDFEQVKQLNPQLSSPDMIMPGMKIKIPATSKPVKKEGAHQKETKKEIQEPSAEKPYKDMSPKPMPVVKEDDVKQPKDVKPKMPMQSKMPAIEQEMNQYTMINLPQIPSYSPPEEESDGKQKEMHYQPHPMPMKPAYQHMSYPPPPTPQYALPNKDCGCGGSKPMHQQPMQVPLHHQPKMEPMKHQGMPMQQPMYQQPMTTQQQPYNGNMMDSYKTKPSNLEMPAKPTLYPVMNDSGSYNPSEKSKSMGMQQGFHSNQMPPFSHPHDTANHMPMPPGFQKKFREEDNASTNE